MKAKACGFEFEIAGSTLNIYVPNGVFNVSLQDACRLGAYLSNEGLLDTKVTTFKIFNNENQELRFNQVTESFIIV